MATKKPAKGVAAIEAHIEKLVDTTEQVVLAMSEITQASGHRPQPLRATEKLKKKAPAAGGTAKKAVNKVQDDPTAMPEQVWRDFLSEEADMFKDLDQRRPFELDAKEQKLADTLASDAVRRVEMGMTIGATHLAVFAAVFLRAGLAPPEPVRIWLVNRLQEIACTESPWKIPLFKRKRGQKNADGYFDQIVIASYYDQQIKKGDKHEVAWRKTRDLLNFLVPGLTGDAIRGHWRKLYGTGKK